MPNMVRYDIKALLSRFDQRVKGDTELTGKLSSLLGEPLLLTVLERYLRTAEGLHVQRLSDRPHRDDSEFRGGRDGIPRDLDAWLLLDQTELAAVECKHWTSSSTDFRSVPEDPQETAADARDMWDWLVGAEFMPKVWTQVNKVALPLKPPHSMPAAVTADARRILAVWTPVSKDGGACLSSAETTTIRDGVLAPVKVDVFSASIYLRELLAAGVTHLDAEDPFLERVLAEVSTLVQGAGISAAV
jgi:hypothetical protein